MRHNLILPLSLKLTSSRPCGLDVLEQQYVISRFIVPASGRVLIWYIYIYIYIYIFFETRHGKKLREKARMISTPRYRVQDKMGREAYQRVACGDNLSNDRQCQADIHRYIMSQV